MFRRQHFGGLFTAAFALTLLTVNALAQDISPWAQQQIAAVLAAKSSLSLGQKKMSSDLAFANLGAQNPATALPPGMMQNNLVDARGMTTVDIKATVSDALLNQIRTLGGVIVSSFEDSGFIRAAVPMASLEAVASNSDVSYVRPADRLTTNAGSVTSQGYVTHRANQVASLGISGSGVRVGVLSSSATAAGVAALIATGDLPAGVTVVPGQDGQTTFGSTDDEGIAMMEIIHDIAPGAQLFFATGNGGLANFANNILTLRNKYNCDIIVDDLTYFAEGAFQDGTIAAAVNTVTASGALYFSSAANSGNITSGTSGTWEGDFVDGGSVSGPVTLVDEVGNFHKFGAANYDVLTTASGFISLKWSDPLAHSNNDYDLFILDSTGSTLKGSSVNYQTGTQDPFEIIAPGTNCGTATASGYCSAAGDRIVVVLFSGSPRALRLDTNRGTLSLATTGSTFGHNAGKNTVSTAATAWNSAHAGTKPFTGFANPIENFSSDGPRKIFYNPDGSAVTPGNILFATNGGITLSKPDVTAADGVFAKTPGFLPFFGTSAAAPHAAAIARPCEIRQAGLNRRADSRHYEVNRD